MNLPGFVVRKWSYGEETEVVAVVAVRRGRSMKQPDLARTPTSPTYLVPLRGALAGTVAASTALILVTSLDVVAVRWPLVPCAGGQLECLFYAHSILTLEFITLLPLLFLIELLSGLLIPFISEHSPRIGLLFRFLANSIQAVLLYLYLSSYEPFQNYPPFIIGLFGVVGLRLILTSHRVALIGTQELTFLYTVVILPLTALVSSLTYWRFFGDYPILYTSTYAVVFLLLTTYFGTLWVQSEVKTPFYIVGATCTIWLMALMGVGNLTLPEGLSARLVNDTIIGRSHFDPKTGQGLRQMANPELVCVELGPETSNHYPSEFPEIQGLDLGEFNVLLITVDTMRYDAVDFKALNTTTPYLASLMSRGAFVFENAIAPSSATMASMASIFSGLPPSSIPLSLDRSRGSLGGLENISPFVPTTFQQLGYSTFRISHGAGFSDNIKGFERGFDRNFVLPNIRLNSPPPDADELLVQEAISTLDSTKSPFFGWVFLVSPHQPLYPRGGGGSSTQELYQEAVNHSDQQIAAIMEKLEELGLEEKTIVLIHSDHGEELGERQQVGHGQTLYEEVIRVPLIVVIPKVTGRVITPPVSLTELFPWLFSFSDTQHQEYSTHRSLLSSIRTRTNGAIISELLGPQKMLVSLRYRNDKIAGNLRNLGVTEYFDLVADPDELNPIRPTVEQSKAFHDYLHFRSCNVKYVLH